MRILYVNICEERAYTGHRLFDVEWAEGLSMIGKVDLIQPHENWFQNVTENINLITYDYNSHDHSVLNTAFFHKGLLERIDLHHHVVNGRLFRYIEKLDAVNRYDVILAAHMDYLMFNLRFWNSKLTKKIYLLEHSPVIYKNKYYRLACALFKNKIKHIVMEKAALSYYTDKLCVKEKLVKHVPHPLNIITEMDTNTINTYKIVGLSNSNSDLEIQKIVEFEKSTNYFKEHEISVILRAKSIKFNDGALTVFTGKFGLSFHDFYSYVLNADMLLLPFPTDFGARTSGTIIDGLSNRKPVLGTMFETMIQYSKDYPEICKTYCTVDEMIEKIKCFFKGECIQSQKDDFERFLNDRSPEKMKHIYMETFSQKN